MDDDELTVMLLYMEPTPYVLGWVNEALKLVHRNSITLFVGQEITQSWRVSLDERYRAKVLPQSLHQAIRLIWGMVASKQYQVVHVSGWGHPILITTIMLARWYRVPLVVESDTPLSPNTSLIRRVIKRSIYPLIFRLPELFLPAGSRAAQYLRHYHVDERRIRIGRMTVDVDEISKFIGNSSAEARLELRSGLGIRPEDMVFLFVGRLETYKGLDVLLSAYLRLEKEHERAVLLVVGDGDLRDWVSYKAGQGRRIKVLGRLSGVELLNSFYMSDVLVLPSHNEPWGLVVNEAMAARLPVIASDQVGSIDDLIEPGVTGAVIESGSVDSLYETMQDFIDHPVTSRQMGERGADVIAKWTLAHKAQIMYDSWQEVTARCR